MAQGPTPATGFQPPPYITSLIAAINDGAKAAQTGSLAVLLVGLYLAATAFSATDEDLLLGKAMTISQIGASLPVTFAFAIAPGVFVFLHIYTLARYDMLAANVRHFNARLRTMVPSDSQRENCLQLLSNVEFVLSMAAPKDSPLRNRLWPILFFGMVAVLPVLLLLMVQVNSLRYQGDNMVLVQRLWLGIDLLLLAIFFHRNSLRPSDAPLTERSVLRSIVRVGWLPAIVVGLNAAYMGIVPVSADPDIVRYAMPKAPKFADNTDYFTKARAYASLTKRYLADASQQPLDVGLCGGLRWGCRFLRVERRMLVDKVWDEKQLVAVRSHNQKLGLEIDGVVLRDRSLRFAVLDNSRLLAANFQGTDFRGASLQNAALDRVDASNADFTGASLRKATMRDGIFTDTKFVDADLAGADLSEGEFLGADLRGADLFGASAVGALFPGAKLTAASFRNADLAYASFGNLPLHAVDLSDSQLIATSFESARLQGAEVSNAILLAANFSKASAWRREGNTLLVAEYSDFRGVRFDAPVSTPDMEAVRLAEKMLTRSEAKARIKQFLDKMQAAQPGQAPNAPVSRTGREFVSFTFEPILTDDPVPEPLARTQTITVKDSKFKEFIQRRGDMRFEIGMRSSRLANLVVAESLRGLMFASRSGPMRAEEEVEHSLLCRLLDQHEVAKAVQLDEKTIAEVRRVMRNLSKKCTESANRLQP